MNNDGLLIAINDLGHTVAQLRTENGALRQALVDVEARNDELTQRNQALNASLDTYQLVDDEEPAA